MSEQLEEQVEHAWHEVNEDPQHRLRPLTRLRLYDLLIGDLETPLLDLLKQNLYQFPQKTEGLKRYFYLGKRTVERVFPIWEQNVDSYLETIVGDDAEPKVAQEFRDFPYIIYNYTLELLKGNSYEELKAAGRWNWGGNPQGEWHVMAGNLGDVLLYQDGMVMDAVYYWYCAVDYLSLPVTGYSGTLTTNVFDADFPLPQDFAYLAAEAFASEDPGRPGWGRAWDLPIQRNKTRLLEFWHWWLSEALLEAATVESDELRWV